MLIAIEQAPQQSRRRAMYPSPKPTHSAPKILGIAFAVLLGLGLLTSLFSGGEATSYPEPTGTVEYSGYESGSGDSQIYDGGSITTGDGGEIIYSDTNGNSFSSGG